MGSNQSQSIISQKYTSLPSIYCEYSDRSAICVPCLYKNYTGSLKPQLIKVNPDGSFCAQNRPGGHVRNCSCTSVELVVKLRIPSWRQFISYETI